LHLSISVELLSALTHHHPNVVRPSNRTEETAADQGYRFYASTQRALRVDEWVTWGMVAGSLDVDRQLVLEVRRVICTSISVSLFT
jgi:hypothetical protein